MNSKIMESRIASYFRHSQPQALNARNGPKTVLMVKEN